MLLFEAVSAVVPVKRSWSITSYTTAQKACKTETLFGLGATDAFLFSFSVNVFVRIFISLSSEKLKKLEYL